MKHFYYRLQQPEGKIVRGLTVARDEQDARENLTGQGNTLLALKRLPFMLPVLTKPMKGGSSQAMIKQLALMTGAALPLRESLSLLIKQCSDTRGQRVIADLYRQVCQGIPLSKAMAQHPRSFEPLCCAVIEAGEWSGDLATALSRYADYQAEQRELRGAIRQALSYPLLLLTVSCLVVGVLLTVAVPKIVAQLSLSGVALPWSTRLVLSLGENLRHAAPVLALLILIAVPLIRYQLKCDATRRYFHHALLRLPGLGTLLRRTQQVRLLMTLSVLCATAVPMADALRLASSAISNLWLRHETLDAVQALSSGAAFTQALERKKLLPEDLLALLYAGEQGGRLGEVLHYLARLHRQQLQHRLLAMVKLLEPLLILLLGLVVLLVFMAIIQPMLSMNSLAF